MKLSLLLTVLTYVTLAASASAAPAYDFLSGGKIGYCAGVTPRVGVVGTVGATRSGGAHGTEENWTQAFFNGPYVPHRDIRADVEAGARGFDIVNQKYDPSLANLVPQDAAFVENVGIRNGKIEVCVSQLNLRTVNQNRGAGRTEILFDVAFKFYVSLDTDAGRKSLLVREVAGSKMVFSPFFDLYYDYSPRATLLMSNSWAPLQSNIATSLAPIMNTEAEQGAAALSAYLAEYFGSNGQ